MENKLTIGNLTINKPTEWDIDKVEFQISEYDYDSTKVDISDLKTLYDYIGEIYLKIILLKIIKPFSLFMTHFLRK